MTTQQPPYPGFQPFVDQAGYPQGGQPGYPQAGQPGYPQAGQPGYPQAGQPGYPLVPPPPYSPEQKALAGYPGPAAGQPNYPLQPPNAAAGAYPQQAFVAPVYPNQGAGINPQFLPPPMVHPQMFPNIPPQSQDDMSDGPKDLTNEWRGFTNKAIRAIFVRKVYAILMLQLIVSFAVVCLFVFEERVNRFVRTHLWMYLMAYVIFLGVYIALACCGNLRRKYPHNVILLSIFTVSQSYMLGVISSFHETKAVMMAVGVCAAICLAVSLFSFHSKFDFTSFGGVLFVLCWVLFLFGIIAIFTRHQIMTTVYAALGTLLFVAFLAYDTQMIMGGKKHELSAEEHIFAAICLYLDIVYIFMFLLMAFGKK